MIIDYYNSQIKKIEIIIFFVVLLNDISFDKYVIIISKMIILKLRKSQKKIFIDKNLIIKLHIKNFLKYKQKIIIEIQSI